MALGSPRQPVFRRLLQLLRPQWPVIGVGLLLLLLTAPCELFPAMAWMYVADHVILRQDPHPWLHAILSFNGRVSSPFALLASAVGVMTVVYLVGETFQTLQQNLMNRVAQKLIYRLRNDVYHKLQSQSLGYLQRQRTGDLMSRAISDIDEIQTFIVNGIDVIIGEGFLWIVTVVLVLMIDWRVAGAALAPLICVYILLRVFNARIKPIYNAARERAGDVATRLQENLSGVVVIKIFSREKQEADRFEQTTRGYYDQQIRAINARSVYFPFARAVGFFSNVAMLGLGGFFILYDGSFTLGKLLAFRAYWWRLFGPVQTLARVNDMVQRAIAAARRVFEVLDAKDELPDAPDAAALGSVEGNMELRQVTFSYPTDLETHGTPIPGVLREINVRIGAGQTVALAGPSGSGKSTVLNLLLRFYDPQQGQVMLDGRDLRSIRRDQVRGRFALVQQETFLFNDSILDNIRYGHSEATMEQVVAAAKAANAHAFITQLPSGYETRVGERGVRLSGGQKQRISIARAFLANPRILLLDEPTSAVEPDSEAIIISALNRLMEGRTTVLTSHRPSLIQQADWVYVLENGVVTESGPPEQLAGNGGWFARFVRGGDVLEGSDEGA